jgi:hypothetical protein
VCKPLKQLPACGLPIHFNGVVSFFAFYAPVGEFLASDKMMRLVAEGEVKLQ